MKDKQIGNPGNDAINEVKYMKTENEIQDRIETLVDKIKEINSNPEKHNLFIHSDNLKKRLEHFVEISHLYEVLEERVPKEIYDIV